MPDFGLDPRLVMALCGLALLGAGRRLYLVLLGVVGFAIGWTLAVDQLALSEEMRLPLAVGLGVLGAVLAYSVEKLALGVAGFLLGVYAALWASDFFGFALAGWTWLVVIVAGLVGSGLLQALFQTTLVVASSWVGALLITRASGLEGNSSIALLAALTIVGVLWQSRLGEGRSRRRLRRRRHREAT